MLIPETTIESPIAGRQFCFNQGYIPGAQLPIDATNRKTARNTRSGVIDNEFFCRHRASKMIGGNPAYD